MSSVLYIFNGRAVNRIQAVAFFVLQPVITTKPCRTISHKPKFIISCILVFYTIVVTMLRHLLDIRHYHINVCAFLSYQICLNERMSIKKCI